MLIKTLSESRLSVVAIRRRRGRGRREKNLVCFSFPDELVYGRRFPERV